MSERTRFVGLDVHKASIAVAVAGVSVITGESPALITETPQVSSPSGT